MLERISFNQYAWNYSLIDIPIKVLINNILILFIIISNTQVTLTDSPLLITKENINCGNLLNKDRFNFLTERVNYRSLTDFLITVIDKKTLWRCFIPHIFAE